MLTILRKTLFTLLTGVAVLIGVCSCSPLKVINALSSHTNAQVTTDVAYGSEPRGKLDVYAPADAKSAPVVVFFYGGSWDSGSRTDYAFVGHALASRGIVAVIADYRLYPEVRYPAFLEDCAQAVAWTAREISRYGGDPHRLFVMGHSAGAYNAAMMALDDRWLAQQGLTPAIFRGWIGLAGPYNFIPIVDPGVRPIFFYPDTPPESQPVNHLSATAPPALLIAASEDKLVDPKQNTANLAAKLRDHGVPVTEIYYDSVSHQTLVGSLSLPLRFLAPTLDTIVHFVDSTP